MKRWREHNGERGAVAVIVAVALVALMAAAAIGVDLARLVYERHVLQNSLDAAAAAGAQQLPLHPLQAIVDAQTFASDNMVAANLGSINPDVALRCVVAYNPLTHSPDWATVSSLCGISSKVWDPLTCNEVVCSVVCTEANACNTIIVKYKKTVDYTFGPAIGIPTGDTGTVVAAACRGFCGKAIPNPMNVAVMADRTYSMSSSAVTDMKTGIENMLGTMTAAQQYVSLGAIHKSIPGTCLTAAPTSSSAPYTTDSVFTLGKPTTPVQFKGSWVPMPYSNLYTKDTGTGPVLDTSSKLVSSVDCMTHVNNGLGTHLASAMKGAARYLLGYDGGASDMAKLPARNPDLGVPKKVIIFETDGRPEELFTTGSATDLELSNANDIGGGSYTAVKDSKGKITGNTFAGNGETGCDNLVAVAAKAKAAGVDRIITIGYGNATKYTCMKKPGCDSSGGALCNGVGATKMVDDYLAKAASKDDAGNPSTADKATCAEENADGDWYFCASSGTDLSAIFLTAMGQIRGHGRLMSLPGIS